MPTQAELFDYYLGKAQGRLDLQSKKEKEVQAAREQKQRQIAREVPYSQLQWDDADSFKFEGQEHRLGGPGGYFADAPENKPQRYVPDRLPEDTDTTYARKLEAGQRKKQWHKQQLAKAFGIEPDEVTDEFMRQQSDIAEQERDKFFTRNFDSSPREGVEGPPEPTVLLEDTGERDQFNRAITRAYRPDTGAEYGEALARDPDRNISYESPYNIAARGDSFFDAATVPLEEPLPTPGSILGDVPKEAAITGGYGALKLGTEILSIIPGAEGLIKKWGWSQRLDDAEERSRNTNLSMYEIHAREKQAKRFANINALSDQRISNYKAKGASENEAQFLNQIDIATAIGKDFYENPGRIFPMLAQFAPDLGFQIIGGRIATLKSGLKYAKKYGKDWRKLLDEKERKKFNRLSTGGGFLMASLFEAVQAGHAKRIETLNKDFDFLRQNSEVYNEFLEKLGDPEKARQATADEAALAHAGITAAAVITTGAVTGATAALTPKIRKGALGRNPAEFVDDAFARAGVSNRYNLRRLAAGAVAAPVGRTARTGGKEAVQEGLEEGIQAGAGNVADQYYLDENQSAWENVGSGVAHGVVGGGSVGTVAGVPGAISERRRQAEARQAQRARPEGRVRFRHRGQDKINPQLHGALKSSGYDILVTSGFRTKERNDAAGGAPRSRHLHGDGVDISLANMDDEAKKDFVRHMVREGGVKNVIAYKGDKFLHIDMSPRNGNNWTAMYSSSGKGADASSSSAALAKAPKWLQEVNQEIASGNLQPATGPGAPRVESTGRLRTTAAAIPKTPVARKLYDEINRGAKRHNMGPLQEAIVHALADIESSYGTNLTGPQITEGMHTGDRAQGPFQWMTKSAQDWGVKDRNNVRQSVDATYRMLAESYDRQRRIAQQKGEKVSDEELWFRAAAGHHSGIHYKKLGEAGRDYLAKLKERVPKYLGGRSPLGGAVGAVGAAAGKVGSKVKSWREKAPGAVQNEGVRAYETDFTKFQKIVDAAYKEAENNKEPGEVFNVLRAIRDEGGGSFNNIFFQEMQRLQKAENLSTEQAFRKVNAYRERLTKAMAYGIAPEVRAAAENIKATFGSPEGAVTSPDVPSTATPTEGISPESLNDINTVVEGLKVGVAIDPTLLENVPENIKKIFDGAKAEASAAETKVLFEKFIAPSLEEDNTTRGPSMYEHLAKFNTNIQGYLNKEAGANQRSLNSVASMQRFLDTQERKVEDWKISSAIGQNIEGTTTQGNKVNRLPFYKVEEGGKKRDLKVGEDIPDTAKPRLEALIARVEKENETQRAIIEGVKARYGLTRDAAGDEHWDEAKITDEVEKRVENIKKFAKQKKKPTDEDITGDEGTPVRKTKSGRTGPEATAKGKELKDQLDDIVDRVIKAEDAINAGKPVDTAILDGLSSELTALSREFSDLQADTNGIFPNISTSAGQYVELVASFLDKIRDLKKTAATPGSGTTSEPDPELDKKYKEHKETTSIYKKVLDNFSKDVDKLLAGNPSEQKIEDYISDLSIIEGDITKDYNAWIDYIKKNADYYDTRYETKPIPAIEAARNARLEQTGGLHDKLKEALEKEDTTKPNKELDAKYAEYRTIAGENSKTIGKAVTAVDKLLAGEPTDKQIQGYIDTLAKRAKQTADNYDAWLKHINANAEYYKNKHPETNFTESLNNAKKERLKSIEELTTKLEEALGKKPEQDKEGTPPPSGTQPGEGTGGSETGSRPEPTPEPRVEPRTPGRGSQRRARGRAQNQADSAQREIATLQAALNKLRGCDS